VAARDAQAREGDAARVAASRPDLAAPVRDIAWRYARLRYGVPGSDDLEALERDVSRLAA
jgi:hypothetical protein